jgi:hypothetical protein
MDLDRPVGYRGYALNTVEDLGDGKRQGCLLEEADFSTVQGIGYVEKRAQGDGNDASDVYLSARQIRLRGFIYGATRADAFDRLQDLCAALSPTGAFAEDPTSRGYLPFDFEVPTMLPEFTSSAHVRLLTMNARPRSQPSFSIRRDTGAGGSDYGGGAINWSAQLECKDPRIYVRPPVWEYFGASESGTLTNRGDYPAPVDVLIEVAASGTAQGDTLRIQIGGADLTITIPASKNQRVFRYSATLGGILTLEENSVIDVLRMDLLSADSNANRLMALPGANTYVITKSSNAPFTNNTRLMFSEAFA